MYHLLLFFHVQPVNQSTLTAVAICHEKVVGTCFRLSYLFYRISGSVVGKTARKNLYENSGKIRNRKAQKKMKLTIRKRDNTTEAKP